MGLHSDAQSLVRANGAPKANAGLNVNATTPDDEKYWAAREILNLNVGSQRRRRVHYDSPHQIPYVDPKIARIRSVKEAVGHGRKVFSFVDVERTRDDIKKRTAG